MYERTTAHPDCIETASERRPKVARRLNSGLAKFLLKHFVIQRLLHVSKIAGASMAPSLSTPYFDFVSASLEVLHQFLSFSSGAKDMMWKFSMYLL